jgi:hypothetical protein
MALNNLAFVDDDDNTLSDKRKKPQLPKGRTFKDAQAMRYDAPAATPGYLALLPPPPAPFEQVERMPRVEPPRKFDVVAGLISQGVNAVAARNQQQGGGGYVQTNRVHPDTPNDAANAGNKIGLAAGGAIDGLLKFVSENPYIVALGALGFFLFMQPSPSQRRSR